jgi:hypothetical protein
METRLGFALAPLLLGLCVAAMLGGCASSENRDAGNRQACVNYGYQPGTDSFATCMMQSDTERSKAAADRQREKNEPRDTETAVPIPVPAPAPITKDCQTTESTEVKGAATQEGQTTSTRTSTVCVSQ